MSLHSPRARFPAHRGTDCETKSMLIKDEWRKKFMKKVNESAREPAMEAESEESRETCKLHERSGVWISQDPGIHASQTCSKGLLCG